MIPGPRPSVRARAAREAMTEAQFQRAVVDLARLRGWMAFHVHDSRRGLGAGFPDLVLVHEATGELLFVELKTSSGRVSAAQQQWLDAFQRGGHDARVWRPAHFATGQIQNALTVRPPTREDH